MTDNQLQYNFNAKRCKRLGQMLEHYKQEADFNEKELNVYSHEIAVFKINEILEELNTLWDVQVDLFFVIRDEYTKLRKQAFLETVRPIKGQTTKTPSAKDY